MKKILVPVDITDKPINLIRYAIGFSQQFKCKILFFYADLPLIPTGYTKEVYIETVNVDLDIRKQVLNNIVEKNRQKLQVKPSLLHYECHVALATNVADDIVQYAEKEQVDLVLMSTHGRSGLSKFFFGSVASAVISHSKTPVFAVPLIYKFRPIKKMLYASDLRNPEYEIDLVKSVGKQLNAKVRMINLNYEFNDPDERILQLVKAKGISYGQFMRRIEYSLIYDLKLYMRNQPNTVLVVFKHHTTGIEKLLFRDSADHLAESIKFPLLTFAGE